MAIPSNRTPVRVARGAAVKFTETIDGVAGAGAKALQDGEIVWDETNERFQVKVGGSDSTTLKNQTVSMADPDFTGNANFGVDGTGSDVKLFGDASGEYLLWDASASALTLDGGDYGTSRGALNVSGEGTFCNSDIHLRQLSEHVASIEIDRSVDDQLILGGDQSVKLNDSTTTPSHSNLTIDWDGNITAFGNPISFAIDPVSGSGSGKEFAFSNSYGGSVDVYHGWVENKSDGDIYIRGKRDIYIQDSGNSNADWLKCVDGGGVVLSYAGDTALTTTDSGITLTANNSSIPGLSALLNLGNSGNCRIEVYDNNAANSALNNNTFRIYSQHGGDNTTKTSLLYDGFFDQVWRTSGSASGPSAELGRVNYDGGWEFYYHDIQGNQGNSWSGSTSTKKFETTALGVTVTGVATGGVYDATSDASSAAASWAIDFADGNNQKVTLAAANLLSVLPTNQTVGQSGSIFITQPGTPLSLGWHSDWKWAGGTAPSLTQTGGATDRLDYTILSANNIHAVLTKAVA